MLRYLIKSMRPTQWIKNGIIFAPLVFSRNLFAPEPLGLVLAAFAIFCLLSGTVYLMNDLVDLERDKVHPTKSKRPLASGKLSRGVATFASVLFLALSLGGAFAIGWGFLVVAGLYFIINLLYSSILKHVVIIDVMVISFGFILRVLGGAVVINVPPTPWLLMCTMLLALFLGFAKRRHELVQLDDANSHRKVLMHYSPYFLDQMIMIVTASTVMSYALYTISADTVEHIGSNHLLYTIPFVLYGIFRYLYLVHLKEGGGSPTRILLTDRPLAVNILLWLVTCVLILEGLL